MGKFSIKDVLGVYFSLKGRIGRGDFWAYGVALSVFAFLIIAIGHLAPPTVGALIQLAAVVAMLWAYMGLLVKRGHDRGRPAAFSIGVLMLRLVADLASEAMGRSPWIVAVQGVLIIYVFIDYAVMPGKAGPNRYGPSPSGLGVVKPLVLGGDTIADSSTLPASPPNA